MDALMALAEHQLAQRYREQSLAGFTGVHTPTPAAPAPMASNLQARRRSPREGRLKLCGWRSRLPIMSRIPRPTPHVSIALSPRIV